MSDGGRPKEAAAGNPDFRRLKSRVIALTGLAYYEDKDDTLAERLERRLDASGAADYAAYLDLLISEPGGHEELDALVAELTIGETFFFRYLEQFEALRTTILPECIERNQAERRLRIWSAGCATGAEPYSVAVLVHELLGERLADWRVTILATDINRDFLARARTGLFSPWALRSLPDPQRAGLFVADQGQWQLRSQYRAMVGFAHHNLISLAEDGAPPDGSGDFDIILCRNVLIYFDRETIRALLPRLADALTAKGWLLVGPSEPNEDFAQVFATVSAPGTTLYRKLPPRPLWSADWTPPALGAVATILPPRPPARPRPPPPAPAAVPASMATPSLSDLVDLADRGCWDEARRLCDLRLAADAMNPLLHYYSALIHQHDAAPAEAEQSYRKAIYLDRGFAMVHFQLGAILAERGDRAGARKAFLNAARVAEAMPDDAALLAGDGLTAGGLRAMVRLRLEGRERS